MNSVKILNSTPWCSLFSGESKFNLKLKPSRYARLADAVLAILISACALIFLPESSVIMMLALGLALSYALYRWFAHHRSTEWQPEMLVIDINGWCWLPDHSRYCILPQSRFNQCGCWLYLTMNESSDLPSTINVELNRKKQPVRQLFIFRDSLSAQDFSRLTRMVTYCQQAGCE